MNIVVTGATGFIGSHVVRELVGRGHSVNAFVRPGASLHRLRGVHDDIKTWPVDLADGAGVTMALEQTKPDALVHLAWYAEPGAYLRDASRNLACLEESVRLLRMVGELPTSRVVLAGTCLEAVPPKSSADEAVYAVAKRALHDVAVNGLAAGMTVTCAHVFSVFGPWEDERRAVPSIIRSLLEGSAVEVSAGHQLRDYVHVADVAAAFAIILESDAATSVDVCTGEGKPIGEVFEEIGRATGREDLIRRGARTTGADEGFDAVGDTGPLRALGWRPRQPFPRRMEETVAWWQLQLLAGSDPVR